MPSYFSDDLDPRNLLRCPTGQERVDGVCVAVCPSARPRRVGGVCVGPVPTCPPDFACVQHRDVLATNSMHDFVDGVSRATAQTFGVDEASVAACLFGAAAAPYDPKVCLAQLMPTHGPFARKLGAAFSRMRRSSTVVTPGTAVDWVCPEGQSVVTTTRGFDCYDTAPSVPVLRGRLLSAGSQAALRVVGCRPGHVWVAADMQCEIPPGELRCPTGQRPYAGGCIPVDACPTGQVDVDGHGTCRPICTGGYERVGLVCLPLCGTDQVRVSGVCQLTAEAEAELAAEAEAARLAALAADDAARRAATHRTEKWWIFGGLALLGIGGVAVAVGRKKR